MVCCFCFYRRRRHRPTAGKKNPVFNMVMQHTIALACVILAVPHLCVLVRTVVPQCVSISRQGAFSFAHLKSFSKSMISSWAKENPTCREIDSRRCTPVCISTPKCGTASMTPVSAIKGLSIATNIVSKTFITTHSVHAPAARSAHAARRRSEVTHTPK